MFINPLLGETSMNLLTFLKISINNIKYNNIFLFLPPFCRTFCFSKNQNLRLAQKMKSREEIQWNVAWYNLSLKLIFSFFKCTSDWNAHPLRSKGQKQLELMTNWMTENRCSHGLQLILAWFGLDKNKINGFWLILGWFGLEKKQNLMTFIIFFKNIF